MHEAVPEIVQAPKKEDLKFGEPYQYVRGQAIVRVVQKWNGRRWVHERYEMYDKNNGEWLALF